MLIFFLIFANRIALAVTANVAPISPISTAVTRVTKPGNTPIARQNFIKLTPRYFPGSPNGLFD